MSAHRFLHNRLALRSVATMTMWPSSAVLQQPLHLFQDSATAVFVGMFVGVGVGAGVGVGVGDGVGDCVGDKVVDVVAGVDIAVIVRVVVNVGSGQNRVLSCRYPYAKQRAWPLLHDSRAVVASAIIS